MTDFEGRPTGTSYPTPHLDVGAEYGYDWMTNPELRDEAARLQAGGDSLTPLETVVDLLVSPTAFLTPETRAKMARQVQWVLDHVREVEPASFICPRCAMRSWNPNDIREGYCGACHDWTEPRVDLTR